VVERDDDILSAVFRALGDPTRREMLVRLSRGDRTIGELARPFRMSLSAASKHVKVLERAGLVRRRVQGRTHLCSLEPRGLQDAQHWLASYERFWNERMDALEQMFRVGQEGEQL
jgi:DNA-binding transcriptional ArsR family regulator